MHFQIIKKQYTKFIDKNVPMIIKSGISKKLKTNYQMLNIGLIFLPQENKKFIILLGKNQTSFSNPKSALREVLQNITGK